MKKGIRWIAVYPLTMVSILLWAWWLSRTVTAFSETGPLERRHRIVIDAGHGGVDGGASSCTGIPESRFNLEIALKLEDLLALLGRETVMIRREDVSVYTKGETIAQKKVSDLKERVRITNETENAVLLSIHQNYFSDGRYSGAQVFYPKTPDSEALAGRLQKAFSAYLDPDNHRDAKVVKGVYLMDRIQCTAVLIECGFLSNPEEEARLRDPGYQRQLCAVIAVTLAGFLSNT